MNFPYLKQLNQQFTSNKLELEPQITINGIIYHLLTSSSKNWEQVMNGDMNVLIYSAGKQHKQEAQDAGLDEWLIFIWKEQNNHVVPVAVKATTAARGTHNIHETQDQQNTIGDTVTIKITNLPSSQILRGKVDTGATISSLHADKWNIENKNVKFISSAICPNVITVPIVDQQSVKSADGGIEYRPVIELNIKINDKLLTNVKFNLNNREHMDYPVLVGQNILEQGKFLIDPSINENNESKSIDWDKVYETIGEISLPDVRSDNINELYSLLETTDITFKDIIKYTKAKINETTDITY